MLSALLTVLLIRGFETDNAQVNIAERVHIFEYGLLALLLYRSFRPRGDLSVLLLTILWVTFAGTMDEFVQWFFQKRTGEIRDVALNAISGGTGLLFALALLSPRGLRMKISGKSWAIVTKSVALLLLLLGLFFSLAHLGHMIEDPEIGRFRSFFSVEELAQLAQEREETWAQDPPTGLAPWDREDYFLTEAGAHANHRGERHQAGDVYRTWQANRILEKYYSPFLDIESFRGSGKHRFPEYLRQDLQNDLSDRNPANYTSPVHAKRIFTRISRPLFLALLLPITLLLFFLPKLLTSLQRRKT
jgi:fumarate reductase subunit D